MGVRGVRSWSIRVRAPGKLLLLCSALEVEPEQNQQDQHQQSMGRGGNGRIGEGRIEEERGGGGGGDRGPSLTVQC